MTVKMVRRDGVSVSTTDTKRQQNKRGASVKNEPALKALLRNVFSSAAREVFFCPPPPYGWNT